MNKKELIDYFKKAVVNPGWQALQWKNEKKGKIIGFLLTDVPEELIHAAGFLPYGICGGHGRLERADVHLQTWACSYVRSSLALALDGKLDFLDGLIIPQTCDTTRMVLGIWQHAAPLPYLQNFRVPRQLDRPSARHYLIGEIARLKTTLEELGGIEITEEKLNKSIRLYNRNRTLLRRLYAFHAQHPASLSAKELHIIIQASMLIPRETLNELLIKLTDSIERETPYSDDRIRLLFSGTLLEPLEILDYLEEGNGIIVGDDFKNGFRYIDGDVKENEAPLEALADRQLKRIPFAGYDMSLNPKGPFLVQLAQQKKAHGVLLLHLKYCEPENFDYYDNFKDLKKAGLPAMRIEVEFGSTPLGQLRTRIQAFLEMLGGDLYE